MGKESRQNAHVKRSLDDARALLRIADSLVADRKLLHVAPSDRQMGEIVFAMHSVWDSLGPVVLRADADLVGALLSTDRDTEIGRQWLGRMRFESVALTFAEPLRIRDGDQVCVYRGFFATGFTSRPTPHRLAPVSATERGLTVESAWTTYRRFSEGDGIRIVWLLEYEGHPNLRGGQTMTIPLRSEEEGPRTIGQLIDHLHTAYLAMGHGEEDAATLVPLGLLLLMYLSSSDPDLSEVDPGPPRRGTPVKKSPRVINLGLRVGGALRSWRKSGPARRGETTGWHLPPHIRTAHWRRSRVAHRDEAGNIVGDVHGDEGVDWEYVLHWIPPTPVNVTADGAQPVVRQLAR